MTTDLSAGNGHDTLTVSANSPLFDLLDHMADTYTDDLMLLEDLASYAAHVRGATAAAVRRAREAGRSWSEVAAVLGVSKQAAQQRFGG